MCYITVVHPSSILRATSIEMDVESTFCFGAAVYQHNSWKERVNNVCFRLSIHVKDFDLHDTPYTKSSRNL